RVAAASGQSLQPMPSGMSREGTGAGWSGAPAQSRNMVTGIIGRKVGMTQVFDPDGTVHPATVIKAGPCVIVQSKTASTDGYEAVQLGLVEEKPAKVGKPLAGHYKKAAVPPTRVRREVRLAPGGDGVKAG